MSHKYTYDETGLASSYLLLSILTPFILYLLIHTTRTTKKRCTCINCKNITLPPHNTKSNTKIATPARYSFVRMNNMKSKILLFILVLTSLFLVYNIMTITHHTSSAYDPYKILGLDISATKKDIRKAFKKIARMNDPDKAPEDMKQSCNDILFEAGRAYNLLNDDDRMAKFVYQRSDQNDIVAIPRVVMNMGWYLFVIYTVLLGVFFPMFGMRKWRRSVGCNVNGVLYGTMDVLYVRIRDMAGDVESRVRYLVGVLCESEEVRRVSWGVNEWVSEEIKASEERISKVNEDDFSKVNDLIDLSKVNDHSKGNDGSKVDIEIDGGKGNEEIGGSSKNMSSKSISKMDKDMFNSKLRSNIEENNTQSNKSKQRSQKQKITKPTPPKQNKLVKTYKQKIPVTNESRVIKFVKHHIEQNFGYPLSDTKNMGYYILMDHLFRTQIFTKDKSFTTNFLNIVSSCKKMALAMKNLAGFESLLVVERCVVQAVFEQAYGEMQVPGVEFLDVFLNRDIKKESGGVFEVPRIEIGRIDAFVERTTGVLDVKENNEENNEENNHKAEDSSSTEKGNDLKQNDMLTKNENNKVFKVSKENLVTVKITLKRPYEQSKINERLDADKYNDTAFIVKTRGERDLEVLNAAGSSRKTVVHAPYLGDPLQLMWSVCFTVDGEVMRFSPVFGDFYGEKDVFVEIESGKEKSVKVGIFVRCGMYFGVDVEDEIVLEYV